MFVSEDAAVFVAVFESRVLFKELLSSAATWCYDATNIVNASGVHAAHTSVAQLVLEQSTDAGGRSRECSATAQPEVPLSALTHSTVAAAAPFVSLRSRSVCSVGASSVSMSGFASDAAIVTFTVQTDTNYGGGH